MDSAGNALGRIGSGPRVILYDAHLDTNEVGDDPASLAAWPHPPLEPVVENDTMFGLGASDCKGGVAAIVYGAAILAQLAREDRAVAERLADVSVVVMGATLEEDAEGFALRSLVERDGLRPEVVLLAEATDLTLRRGQRGRCEVRVRTEGRAAHASQPHLGESALLKMLPVIQALEAMNGSLPVDPIFGAGTQVVSLIEGPHTPNSVPAWCEVAIDRRLTPDRAAPRRSLVLPRLAAGRGSRASRRRAGDERRAVGRARACGRLALLDRWDVLGRRGGHPHARLRAGRRAVRPHRAGPGQPVQAAQGE